MNPALAIGLLVLAYALCVVGCALLAFSQTRNWRLVMGDRKAQPPRTAVVGWLFILIAVIPCIVRDGGSFAALLWPLVFAAGAMSVAMVLTYRPEWLKPLALWVPKKL